MLFMGVFTRAMHELLFKANAPMPIQMLAIVVLFAFPFSVMGQLLMAVNSVFFGAMPLVMAHWAVRILGGTSLPTSEADPPRGFTTSVTAGV
jgi:hypothetical protein